MKFISSALFALYRNRLAAICGEFVAPPTEPTWAGGL
jgi:hypothetical protein